MARHAAWGFNNGLRCRESLRSRHILISAYERLPVLNPAFTDFAIWGRQVHKLLFRGAHCHENNSKMGPYRRSVRCKVAGKQEPQTVDQIRERWNTPYRNQMFTTTGSATTELRKMLGFMIERSSTSPKFSTRLHRRSCWTLES